MSADRWKKCPKCVAKARKEHEKKLATAEASYGKVTREKYAELVEAANLGEDVTDNTLREDWELGMDEDGLFFISYSASCECGFKFNYKKEVDALPG